MDNNNNPNGSSAARSIIIILIIIAIIVALVYAFSRPAQQAAPMIPAPAPTTPAAVPGYTAYTDPDSGRSLQYPATLGTSYIHTVDWPPKIAVDETPFTCTPAGSATAPAGITDEETINGHTYCVTKETGAAAGSIYDTYAYAFPFDNNTETAILTFSLQYPQCANYEDPQKTACSTEENSFAIGPIADTIAQTVQ